MNPHSSITIIDLPISVCENIVNLINDTHSYKNLRISCSFFYFIMDRLKIFYKDTNNLHKIMSFKHGTIHGEYISFYKNYTIFKRYQYNYGLKEGSCKIYYPSGHIKEYIDYKYGIKNGYNIKYFETGGIKHISLVKNNTKYNNELDNNSDGSLNYIIKYHNNDKHTLTKFFKNGIKLIAELRNKILDGNIYLIDKKNNISQLSQFFNGEIHGTYKKFSNGNIQALINYSFGKRQGLAYFWNNNCIEKMCNYKYNLLDGVLKYWGTELQLEATYSSDYLNHCKYFINNRKICIDYLNNEPHGYYKEYHYDNILKYRIKFKYSKFDKIYKKYYFTGDIQYEYIYHNQTDVTITNYDINGIMKYKIVKKDKVYNIYHKFSNNSLTYNFN